LPQIPDKGFIDTKELIFENSFFYELNRPKLSDFTFSLESFNPLEKEPNLNNAKLVIYAIDEYFELNWFAFSADQIALPFETIEFKNYQRIYLQYVRKDRISGFKLGFNIKPSECKKNNN
jgi:hypothetical protein